MAVGFGVTIDARTQNGAPRLIRAIVPRPGPGMTPDQAARDHLTALRPLWLSNQRPADMTTHSVQKLRNGASIVRLRQEIDQVPIHQGELRVLVHPDGSLAAVAGTMLPNAARPTFRSTAAAAVDRALDALYGPTRARPILTEAAPQDGYSAVSVASTPEFIVHAARAKRELFLDGARLVPVHSIEIVTEKINIDRRVEPAARRYLIAADDGRVLRDVNLIESDAFVYRALAETTGTRIPLDGAFASYTPHPTGFPDGSVPGFGPYNLVVQDSFNGPRDPWLSPIATTTSGNNVDAFADISPPLGFTAGDIRPEVRGGRTLNFRYDFTAEPLATVDQSKAAAVNVFYVTNWLHDWYYDSGFTEATGNAQVDNFGRGGIGGDPLLALAQADALGVSRDNAFMMTPEDGLSPRMRMFLWTGASETSLTTPTATPNTARFTSGPRNFDVTAQAVQVVDVVGGEATACGEVTNAVAGKIAFVKYAFECPSETVMENVKAAGAIGLVAMINFPAPAFILAGSPTANLPGLVIGFDDGNALAAQLPTTLTIHLGTTIEHDGDFDNALIAHEWGHYLHHRLAPCEATVQCHAMSEGWGDFNALLMMLRPTDNRDGTFGVGLYALTAGGFANFGFLDPGYFGIRRFPYSLDRTRNALSFRHISDDAVLPDVPTNPGPSFNLNSEVHNAGEIWAQMLWEAYNVLIDEHGIVEAHRRMTDYVVAGLLLTPAEATYTEARDAILAVVGALDTDDMLLMAAAFAGRGAGTCAESPPNTSSDLIGVVESGTIAAKLGTSTVTLIDDGASCDHDGYLDPGESGTLRITVANSGVIAAEDVIVSATTTSTGVTLGKAVRVGTIAPLTHVDVAIPVRIAATAPTNTNLDIAVAVNGVAGCNTGNLAVEFHERMGVDEVAAAATSDSFETRTLGWTLTGTAANQFWSRKLGAGANHILFGADAPFRTDTQVVSPVLQASATTPLVVTLKHAFDLEQAADGSDFFDGSVIEVSNDGGATFHDITQVGVDPGYPVVITPLDPENPLRNRRAFGGRSPGFPALQSLTLNFGTQFAGQGVQLRFRLESDVCCNATGWLIDDVNVTGITNTPFPGLVSEPTRCTAPTPLRELEGSGVVDVRQAPHKSLASVPAVEPL